MKQIGLILLFFVFSVPAFSQSTNQDFPSPVLQNEISGTITARDIGDPRLTSHFYTFYAGIGDLFLNVETSNLNGDIDLFEATTLRPLSKISIYAGDAAATTSRIVYFRQRIQVVMRVEGRTPNDEPANYRINFTGSFASAANLPQPPEDLEPRTPTRTSPETVSRVNSAGAIIEVLPKKQPETAQEEPANTNRTEESTNETTVAKSRKSASAPKTAPVRRSPRRSATPKPSAQTDETKPDENTSGTTATNTTPRRTTTPRRNPRTPARRAEATSEPKVDPLANIQLVVLLKDGRRIERPMSEILRVSVDKGTLVVITKAGKIERFALIDVQRFSIEQ